MARTRTEDFDREHRVHDLPEIPDDTEVWVTSDAGPIPGRIVTAAETPRSYVVETPTGEVRRNRSQLRVQPETPTAGEETPADGEDQPPPPQPSQDPPKVIMTRSRTGTQVRPPACMAPMLLNLKGEMWYNCALDTHYYHYCYYHHDHVNTCGHF